MVLKIAFENYNEGSTDIQKQHAGRGRTNQSQYRDTPPVILPDISELPEGSQRNVYLAPGLLREGGNFNNRNETPDVVQEQARDGGPPPIETFRTLCIWNLDLHLVPDVWHLMSRAVTAPVYAAIIQIRRICQKNHKIRFEIDVPEPIFTSFCASLQAKSRTRRFQWKVYAKDISIGRKISAAKAQYSPDPTHKSLTICSYNINGFVKKRADLEAYLLDAQIDIIGIQETRRQSDHWRLHLEGFDTVEMTSDQTITGARGIAIAVRKGISAFPVGRKTNHFLFIRVFGTSAAQPFIIGTVYLPHGRARNNGIVDATAKRRVEEELAIEIRLLQQQYPTDLVLCMGDFNKVRKDLSNLAMQRGLVVRQSTNGVERTCTKGASGNAIDHILITQRHSDLLTDIHVDRSLDGSDHWPLLASLHTRRRSVAMEPSAPRLTWNTSNVPTDVSIAVATHNFWAPLFEDINNDNEDDEPGEKISKMGTAFTAICNTIGDSTRLTTARGRFSKHVTSREHMMACRERRRLYCELKHINRNSQPAQYAEAFWAYQSQRKISAALAGKVKKTRWATGVIKASDLNTSNSRNRWRWMTSTAGWRRRDRSDNLNPVRDADGVLQLNGPEIREVWRSHFGRLASDVTGHSQDKAHWERTLPGVPSPTIDSLNCDLSRSELVTTLRRMKRHKAPGPDGIPVDFIRLFLSSPVRPNEEADFDSETGNIALNKLLELLIEMWNHGCVPESMNKAALVYILKKGDPTDCGNYRGISLMDSAVKILISVLTARLSDTLETRNLISKAQAGFRRKEECAAQGLALYETIKRRFNLQKPTYALFLDFQKAYDTVPHEALFRKMDLIGIRGRFSDFLKGLYKDSIVAVRTTDGSSSAPFSLLRGLRQGCPMSPILFDLFINDIFEGCDEHGVMVPATTGPPTRRKTTTLLEKIPGLLFADDGVLLSPTQETLRKSKDLVAAWANLHEMSFGIAKCGLLFFRELSWGPTIEEENTLAFSNLTDWQIDGEQIPVVSNYTYLGLDIHNDLNISRMSKDRLKKGTFALHSLEPFLRCSSIPPGMKVTMVEACVKSTLLYGSEIWGMKVPRVIRMRKLMTQAARWILGFRGPAALSSVGALLGELGIEDVAATVARRRTRAYLKFPHLRTWISDLLKNPLCVRRKNWQTITEMWLNRQVKAGVGASTNAPGHLRGFMEDKDSSMKLVQKKVISTTRAQWEKSAPGLIKYYKANYKSLFYTPARIKTHQTWTPYFGHGLCLLSLLRGNGFPTYQRLWKAGLVPAPQCPFCGSQRSEDRIHLILHCRAWKEDRERYLRKLITDTRLLGTNDEEVVTLLLGGTVDNKKIPYYYPYEGEVIENDDRALGTFDDGARGEDLPLWASKGCYMMAGFLERVDKRRSRIIKDKGAPREALELLIHRPGTTFGG